MDNKNWQYAFGGLVLGIVLMWILSSTAVNNRNLGMMNMMGFSRSSMMGSTDNIDQHFIEQMVPHHKAAVDMADLALQKAEHEEIKQLAQSIKNAQTREIEWMEKWYKDWFGKTVSLIPTAFAHMNSFMGSMNGMGMMGDNTDLESLADAKPFDKEFIEQMIPHHQTAVMMARMLETGSQREELKDLAHDIIDGQNAEIDKMRGWYKAWYQK